MANKEIQEDEQGSLNKGHRFGVLFPDNNYYFADALRKNESGEIEFFCIHKTHSRYGISTAHGLIVDYNPVLTLEDFKTLPGQLEPAGIKKD